MINMIIMIKVFRCGAVVDDPSSGHVRSPDNTSELELMQIYQSFYKPLHNLQSVTEQPQLEQDYKYNLNRTIC